MILDHPLVGREVFFPRKTTAEPNLVVDVSDATLACYHLHRHPHAGTLLHFHGNGELAAEDAAAYGEQFLDLGVNVCFAEYRGYGLSTGSPALAAMLGDGEKIVRALGVPAERLVVFGRSLGSLYAIELAHRLPGLAGLVLDSAIAGVLDVWPPGELLRRLAYSGGVSLDDARAQMIAEVTAHFDLRAKMQSYRGRLLVLHTEHDHLVEPSHAQRLHAWAGGSDKRLVMFPHGDHNSIFVDNADEYVRELADFLRQAGVVVVEG